LESSRTEENVNRIENIRELQGAVAEFDRLNPDAGLEGFLENVALVSDMDSMEEHGGAVTLMTLHSAKGLEFEQVFIPGMEETIFPISRAIYDEAQLEEERRLAYVGITRARQRLFLSHARTRLLYNNRQANELSRFVSEIPLRLITDGTQSGAHHRVPPPSGRAYGQPGYSNGYPARGGVIRKRAEESRDSVFSGSGVRSMSAGGNALGIPGVQKGFGTNVVPSGARAVRSVALFKPGDAVIHKAFGRGRVVEVTGAGEAQRVKVDFGDRGEKIFSASVAPIVKVGE
ncbi:MAG: 3'-5' exonuclease, partial [Christensenellales bacterium]|nr:3'-5' exonuclease [Christensenellales bacterium]